MVKKVKAIDTSGPVKNAKISDIEDNILDIIGLATAALTDVENKIPKVSNKKKKKKKKEHENKYITITHYNKFTSNILMQR